MLNGMLGRVLDGKDCQYVRCQDGTSSCCLSKKSIPPSLCHARSVFEACLRR